MSWFGKITFGMIGLALGGPLGAIAGLAIGHVMVDSMVGIPDQTYRDQSYRDQSNRGQTYRDQTYQEIPKPDFERVEQTQAAYFISLFSILGKMSKIDGLVTKDEITVVKNFINRLPMEEREKRFARQVFNEAKNSHYAIEDFAVQLFQIIHNQPDLVFSFFNLLFELTAADGTLHSAEETALKRIKNIFRLSDRQYEDTKAIYFGKAGALDKHYKMLNCTPESSIEEIKSNYKKLVKDFHPDKIIAKGLPEEFIDFAERRFREIQESYEKIQAERRF